MWSIYCKIAGGKASPPLQEFEKKTLISLMSWGSNDYEVGPRVYGAIDIPEIPTRY